MNRLFTFQQIKQIFKNGYESEVTYKNAAGDKRKAKLKISNGCNLFEFENEICTYEVDFQKERTQTLEEALEMHKEMVLFVEYAVNRFMTIDLLTTQIEQLNSKIKNGTAQIKNWAAEELPKKENELKIYLINNELKN